MSVHAYRGTGGNYPCLVCDWPWWDEEEHGRACLAMQNTTGTAPQMCILPAGHEGNAHTAGGNAYWSLIP